MAVELVVPSVGESITKVQIGQWLRAEGERIERDRAVVEIETDKATIELPAPITGTLTKILKRDGESAAVGDVIGYLEPVAAGVEMPAATNGDGAMQKTATAQKAAVPAAKTAVPAPKTPAPPTGSAPAEPRVMPAARRVLTEQGLSASAVEATGPGGRVLKEDVLRHVQQGGAPRDGGPAVHETGPSAGRPTPAAGDDDRLEEPVPMSPLRRRVAERLVAAQQTAALLTTFNEIDMSAVLALRKQHQDAFTEKYGIKLGFMSFFVKAAIDALKLIPQVNAEIRDLPGPDGQSVPHIVYRNYYDIGVAVSGGKGLVVPVIRSAERLSFAEIEQIIGDFGARARENKIKLEELQGGTFTISNGGIFGSLMSTPIVNPPQPGILGLHAIQDRPVARDGAVVIRSMMYVALTYDHRIIDGREAVTFLKRIKECVENPTRMLIEV